MKNRVGKAALSCLVVVLGLGFLVGCATPAKEAASPPSAPSTPVPPAAAPSTPAPPAVTAPVAPAPAAQFPIKITDELGRVVTVKRAPQRIVSLAPSNMEILFSLGLGDKIIGRTDYDDYPPAAKSIASVGGYTNPSIEKIVALSPDIIFVVALHKPKVIPVLESMGYTVIGLDPQTVDQVLDAITLVGKVTGETEEASRVTASLQTRIKAVTDKTDKLTAAQRPKTFYIVWPDPLMSAGNSTFQSDLIQKAGGTNIAQGLNGWATISLEAVITANPEIMIAGTGADMASNNSQFIKTEPRLANTDARRLNKVYEVDGNKISRPGPRLVDALEQFAKVIHPELFK